MDTVKVLLQNDFKRDVYFSISLEKQINDSWILYSQDVFTKPFSKLFVQNLITSSESRIVGFTIQHPELFEQNIKPAKGNAYKIGVFRLRVNFGFTADNLEQEIVLSEFKTYEP